MSKTKKPASRKPKPRTMPAKERAPKHTAGVSESFVEMAAEITDPAWWATLQLTKGGQSQPKTIGEAHQRIASIFRQAIDMEIARKPKPPDDGCGPRSKVDGALARAREGKEPATEGCGNGAGFMICPCPTCKAAKAASLAEGKRLFGDKLDKPATGGVERVRIIDHFQWEPDPNGTHILAPATARIVSEEAVAKVQTRIKEWKKLGEGGPSAEWCLEVLGLGAHQ